MTEGIFLLGTKLLDQRGERILALDIPVREERVYKLYSGIKEGRTG